MMKTRLFKFFSAAVIALTMAGMSSCSGWLDILPNNEQVTDNYWKSKEDVEAVIASGYYYMRQSVTSFLIWGEVRGGTLYSSNTADTYLQNFNMTPSQSVCSYANLYKVIGMANSVLKYAPSVMTEDDTYYESVMKSHLCEAYFMRAYCYLVMVKNFREVPLVVEAYVNDQADYMTPKSSEDSIIAQIKADMKTAIALGAAKDVYEDTDGYGWQSKGRVTRWALYALMADVCLWNHDYDEAIVYCNYVLDVPAGDTSFRPRFIQDPSQWYSIFYPGNSNESIFELNWEKNMGQNNNFGSWFTIGTSSRLRFTDYAQNKMTAETQEAEAYAQSIGYDGEGRVGRMLFGSFVSDLANQAAYATATGFYVWKYKGTDVVDKENVRPSEDANFILYRVPDLMLIKAEALVMKGGADNWTAAIGILNEIRERACLNPLTINVAEAEESEMLDAVMYEWEMEFLAEGKRWYDLLRYARYDNGSGQYVEHFVNEVVEGNQTTKDEWIRSVLLDPNAWYMPIPYSEIQVNSKLEQNPYYQTQK